MPMGIIAANQLAEPAGTVHLVIRHGLLLLAVVNPIGNIPIFADLTREMESRERGRVMNLAVLISWLLVVAFALVGDWSLKNLFGVTVGELEIAGGILLFMIALRNVLPTSQSYQHPKDSTMLAVFPIAFPLLVGPGAITLTIITTQQIGHLLMIVTAAATFAVVLLITRYSDFLMRLMGPYAAMIVARLLFIFLAAKAVSMVLDGTSDYLMRFFPAAHACLTCPSPWACPA
jgi:multiple antibiotic resistance protein